MDTLFERHLEYLSDVPTSFERELVKGKVDFPQIGLEKGTTERGIPKVSKSCQHYKFLSIF